MKKVFNRKNIDQFLKYLMETYRISFITANDVASKQVFKKLKGLKLIHNAKSLFLWMKKNDSSSIVPMVKKFFPNKMEEIESSGLSFEIKNFGYDPMDEKVHCYIIQGDSRERSLKLFTDLYEERTREYVDKMIESLRKEFGRFYGYWLVDEDTYPGNWYITDKNLIKDGKYAVVVESKNGNIRYSSGNFGQIESFDDLIF